MMKLHALELLVVVLLLSSPCLLCLANSTVSQLDRQADMLLQWKSGLDGQSACLDSWSKNTSPCNWNGVDCSISNESDAVLIVVSISLPLCDISGTLCKTMCGYSSFVMGN
jgi:hypothetical protein